MPLYNDSKLTELGYGEEEDDENKNNRQNKLNELGFEGKHY